MAFALVAPQLKVSLAAEMTFSDVHSSAAVSHAGIIVRSVTLLHHHSDKPADSGQDFLQNSYRKHCSVVSNVKVKKNLSYKNEPSCLVFHKGF